MTLEPAQIDCKWAGSRGVVSGVVMVEFHSCCEKQIPFGNDRQERQRRRRGEGLAFPGLKSETWGTQGLWRNGRPSPVPKGEGPGAPGCGPVTVVDIPG
jgi:hypothetical protein